MNTYRWESKKLLAKVAPKTDIDESKLQWSIEVEQVGATMVFYFSNESDYYYAQGEEMHTDMKKSGWCKFHNSQDDKLHGTITFINGEKNKNYSKVTRLHEVAHAETWLISEWQGSGEAKLRAADEIISYLHDWRSDPEIKQILLRRWWLYDYFEDNNTNNNGTKTTKYIREWEDHEQKVNIYLRNALIIKERYPDGWEDLLRIVHPDKWRTIHRTKKKRIKKNKEKAPWSIQERKPIYFINLEDVLENSQSLDDLRENLKAMPEVSNVGPDVFALYTSIEEIHKWTIWINDLNIQTDSLWVIPKIEQLIKLMPPRIWDEILIRNDIYIVTELWWFRYWWWWPAIRYRKKEDPNSKTQQISTQSYQWSSYRIIKKWSSIWFEDRKVDKWIHQQDVDLWKETIWFLNYDLHQINDKWQKKEYIDLVNSLWSEYQLPLSRAYELARGYAQWGEMLKQMRTLKSFLDEWYTFPEDSGMKLEDAIAFSKDTKTVNNTSSLEMWNNYIVWWLELSSIFPVDKILRIWLELQLNFVKDLWPNKLDYYAPILEDIETSIDKLLKILTYSGYCFKQINTKYGLIYDSPNDLPSNHRIEFLNSVLKRGHNITNPNVWIYLSWLVDSWWVSTIDIWWYILWHNEKPTLEESNLLSLQASDIPSYLQVSN